jgi:NAD(P)H-dependent flavin oxidoreductase YrpB (nitropropane dioxygenase family)
MSSSPRSGSGSGPGFSGLRDLFGVDLPIIGAPMGGVAGSALAGAVSQAGGLGVLGHANLAPDQVREEIRETQALTSRPFGIGLLFPSRETPIPETRTAAPLPDFLRALGDPGTREGRVLSRLRPAMPSSRYRCCHRQTVGFDVWARRMISKVP